MHTKTKVTLTHEVEKLTDIVCDRCGKSIWTDEATIAGGKLIIDCGYGSKHDFDVINYDVCDHCVSEIRNSFNKEK